jgi:hypothetical protein
MYNDALQGLREMRLIGIAKFRRDIRNTISSLQ